MRQASIAMTQPRRQQRHLRAVDERRPQELERRDERDQAKEADHFQGEARRAEPRGEGVEDEVVGQAGRKAERDHDERGALGVHAKGAQERALARRRFHIRSGVISHQ
jgi:hypothetical protein